MTDIHDTIIAEQQKLIEQQREFIKMLLDERAKYGSRKEISPYDVKFGEPYTAPQMVPNGPWIGPVSCRDASNDHF